MSEIVVGIDDSAGARNALAFARRLAAGTGATLRLVSAYPYDEWLTRAASHEYGTYLFDEATKLIERVAESLDVRDAPHHAVADPSPARALQRVAERTGADLIVVGSTHRGAIGRVLPGSTGERLLHGAPCPVAVVPRGDVPADAPIRAVAVGFDATDESEAALAAACHVARRTGATLRVIRVFDATRVGNPGLMTGPSYVTMHEDYEAMQREGLDQAVAALPDALAVEARFLAGYPGHELAAQSESADLMIVGSRGYGPLAAVLLGGAGHTLLRKAGCPVIVLPRGARGGIDALFAPATEAASS